MDKGRYNAQRLVRTECKYFANQGELMGYKENGIKRYRFIGGTEGSGSCTCAELNGQVFNVEEAVAGINYPPIHPNCLCIVVADFGDKGMFSRRTDAEPLEENVKFREWKEKYVDGPAQSGIIPLTGSEERALKAYISSDSYKINDKLRRGAALTERDHQLIESLDRALDKMPEIQGTIYRSVSKGLEIEDVDAFVAEHVVGVPMTFPSYISASTAVYDDSMEIQYVIVSKHGKNITDLNKAEREVLFQRGTWFMPTRIEGHTIYMEEV